MVTSGFRDTGYVRQLARLSERNVAGVQAEIAQEKAASLARAAARLQASLARLAAFDAEATTVAACDAARAQRDAARAELVYAAAEALLFYVVQREACGLCGTDAALREYGVPHEVRLRMGYYGAAARRRRAAMQP